MNSRLSHPIHLGLATQIVACSTPAVVENLPAVADTSTSQFDQTNQWRGASVSELIAALGSPAESLNAIPEQGLSPTLSWYSNSEDYAALELLEIESVRDSSLQQLSYRQSAYGSDSHECQIHANLSDDGLRVEQLTLQSIGDCERWLPVPNRLNGLGTMTAAVDE